MNTPRNTSGGESASRDVDWRKDRELRAFLEAFDLRQYAHEMQQLIELGLPTVATSATASSAPSRQPSPATVLEQLAEVAGRLEAGSQVPDGVLVPTGLPRPSTLVGRDRELAYLASALRSGSTHVALAVQGMVGIGKTALVAEAVARMAEDGETFPGGAVWIPAEGLVGSEGLAVLWARLAAILQLHTDPRNTDLSDPENVRLAIGRALAQRPRTLLALDNLEPGLNADALLNTIAIPDHTAVVVTARRTIAPQRAQQIELASLPTADSVSLFTQRLQQVDSARPTRQDMNDIPAIVDALGGLPLAIELVAAYAGLQHLPLGGIVPQLAANGIDAAVFGVDARRSLFVVFEQAWQALTRTQQLLLAGLSLLNGNDFPRDAALAIATASQRLSEMLDTVRPEDDLANLVAYSLIEPHENGRLRLHPLLHDFATQKLEHMPDIRVEALGSAMLNYWLAFAQANSGYDGLDVLENEHAGLMQALAWAHTQEQNTPLLALMRALDHYWAVRGRIEDLRLIRPWALAAAHALNDLSEENQALHNLANLSARMGDITAARAGYQEALALAETRGDLAAELTEIHSLAVLDERMGDITAARAGYVRALALAEELNDMADERVVLNSLAVLDTQVGDLASARAGFERALALAQTLGDPVAERAEIHGLATLAAIQGDVAQARAGFERALSLAQELGDHTAEQAGLRGLASVLLGAGKVADAKLRLEQALTISEAVGDPYESGLNHELMAELEEQEGQNASAVAHYREAIHEFELAGSPRISTIQEALARVEAST